MAKWDELHRIPETITLYYIACKLLPLNIGDIFQIEIGPCEENWPRHISMKNRGMAVRTKVIPYGIKNEAK